MALNRSPGAYLRSLICISSLALHVLLPFTEQHPSENLTEIGWSWQIAASVAKKTPSVILKVIIFNLFSPSGCFVISHKFFASISDTKICTSTTTTTTTGIFSSQQRHSFVHSPIVQCGPCRLSDFRGEINHRSSTDVPHRPGIPSRIGKLLALPSVIYRFPFGITVGRFAFGASRNNKSFNFYYF